MKQSDFLQKVENWNNHLPLLWMALEATSESDLPVIEFGSGDGSTKYLKQYCEDSNRKFLSYDYNKEWAEKTGSTWVSNWEIADIYTPCSVILVDESPGENRYKTIEKFMDKATILVVHDSEAEATGYMLDKIWHLFKYRVNLKSEINGAEATAISNFFDVTSWGGMQFGQYKLSK